MARRLAAGQVCRIFTYEVATGVTRLVHVSDDRLYEAPNWTAAGDLVVNGDGRLWTLPADGSSAPREIVYDGLPELNNDHVLAPDGETIYLSADDWHIYAASLRGGAVRQITQDDGRMHFLHGISPDGLVLAYVGVSLPFAAQLWTIGVDGKGDARLTGPGGGPDDGPEYAPDGDWIYFNTERFDGHAQIARIRPDGSGLEQLTFDERVNWFPHLAPTGEHAVHLSYPPGTAGHPADLPVELRLVTGDDWRSARTVAALPGGQGTINVNSWSPDGTFFAYADYPLSSS